MDLSLEEQTFVGEIISDPKSTVILTDIMTRAKLTAVLSKILLKNHKPQSVLIISHNRSIIELERAFIEAEVNPYYLADIKRTKTTYTIGQALVGTMQIIANDVKKGIVDLSTISRILIYEGTIGLDSKSLYNLQRLWQPEKIIVFTVKGSKKNLITIAKTYNASLKEINWKNNQTPNVNRIDISLSEEYSLITNYLNKDINKKFQYLIDSGYLSEERKQKRELYLLLETLKMERKKKLAIITTYILYHYEIRDRLLTQGMDLTYKWLQELIKLYKEDDSKAWHFYLQEKLIQIIIQFMGNHKKQLHPKFSYLYDYIEEYPEERLLIICNEEELRKVVGKQIGKQYSERTVLVCNKALSKIKKKEYTTLKNTFKIKKDAIFVVSSLKREFSYYTNNILVFSLDNTNTQNLISYLGKKHTITALVTRNSKEPQQFFNMFNKRRNIDYTQLNEEITTVIKDNGNGEEKLKIIIDPRLKGSSIPFNFDNLQSSFTIEEERLPIPGILIPANRNFIFILYIEYLQKLIIEGVVENFCKQINDFYPSTTVIIPKTEKITKLAYSIKKQLFRMISEYGFTIYVDLELKSLLIDLIKELSKKEDLDYNDIEKTILLLKAIPSINTHKAKRLATAYSTISSIIESKEEELQSISGIGSQLAKEIKLYIK